MPQLAAEHFAFSGYALPRDLDAAPRRDGGAPLVVGAAGGTTSGADLLRRVIEAISLLRGDIPDARLLAVCGRALILTRSPPGTVST